MDSFAFVAARILGMGVPELLLILGIALLIFGPKNLPKLGASLGKTVRSVREGMEGKELDEGEVVDEDEGDDDEEEPEPATKKKSSKKN